jgi:ABC-2 type transport system permease protein
MKEILLLLAPQWWSIKNRIVGLDQTLYFRSLFLLLFGGGFWAGSIYLLNLALSRLQGLSAEAGSILILKGLSLFILVSFFLLVFSGLITAISRFYLSQELTMLLSFPISRGKIFAAKWFETLLSSSWMVLLFGLPLFFSFGLQSQVSWWYYPWFLVCFILFIPIPVSMGICLAILLMSVLPARRGKNLFMFIGFLIFGFVYLLFRFMRPERMINPEWFANMTIFLADMQTPTSIFLPSMWMAETLGPFFGTGEGTPVFYALLLGFTGAAFMVFGYWIFEALFTRGWLKAQEGKKVLFTVS